MTTKAELVQAALMGVHRWDHLTRKPGSWTVCGLKVADGYCNLNQLREMGVGLWSDTTCPACLATKKVGG
jgi:hypothetical protein